MINHTQRPLSAKERQQLLLQRPSFLFRSRRKLAQQELDEGVADVILFEAIKGWDIGGCQPPCCPHSFLFQVTENEFIYTESWFAFAQTAQESAKRELQIVRSPRTRRILSVAFAGEPLTMLESPLDPATDYFPVAGNSECELIGAGQLSEEVMSLLAAT
jgi:hypothetical protein